MRHLPLLLASIVMAATPAVAHADLDVPLSVPLPPVDAPPHGSVNRAAVREYLLQRVGLESTYSDDSGSSGMQPYVGKYHRPLEEDDFLHLVGRDDLAESYRIHSGIRTTLLIGAIAGTVVGSAAGLRLLTEGSDTSSCMTAGSNEGSCIDAADHAESSHVEGGVLLLTGATTVGTLLITGLALWDPNPVPDWEMRSLADDYNTRLRARLGLPEDESDFAGALLSTVTVAPFAAPSGSGLALSGRF